MLGDEQFAASAEHGSRPGCSRSSASASSPGSPTCSPATPPTTSSREIDEVGVRDGGDLVIEGYDFAPTFSIWTTIEECLNPPVIWERDRGWFTTEPFSEPETFVFPGRHRPDRVRERRARRGAAHPAVGRLQARHVQVRARRRVHRGAARRCTRPGLDRNEPVRVRGVEVSPRDVVAATLPEPAELGDRMHGQTCAGTWVTGHRHRRHAPRGVPVPRGRQRLRRWPTTAIRRSCGRPRSTRSSRSSCSQTGAWEGVGVLGPEAFDAVPFLDLLAAYGSPHGMVELT